MKSKSSKLVRFLVLAFVLCAIVCLAGCGKAVTINVIDGDTTTQVEAKTSMTVRAVLEGAGITLGEKDETVPEADAKIKDATEITVKRYAKVTVKYGEEEKTVELVGGTVAEAVSQAGFTMGESVKADAEDNAFLTDGMVITLLDGTEITLKVDGKTKKITTFAETVADVLAEQNIALDDDDEVSADVGKKIKKGIKITVKRVEYKEETKTEVINFAVKETKSSSMAAGTKKVTRDGVSGEKEVTYKVKYVDGKEDSREVLSEKVIKEAVDKLVTVGTKSSSSQSGGKSVVSKQAVYDCDGSGHGYYVITYSDGSVKYEDF